MHATLLARLLRGRWELSKRDGWTRRRLETHQAGALRDLRDFAYSRSDFYRRFHKGLTNRPLHELPVLTKAELMGHFDELVTDRAIRLADVRAHVASLTGEPFLGRYWVALTSGSTGLPGLFVCNEEEWATVLASYTRANDWAGVRAGLTRRLRLAVVSSRTPWHQSTLVGTTLQSQWIPTIRLDASDPVTNIVARLNEFQPQSLVAYASMARLLAEEQLAGRLRIAPEAVMCASEVLTDASRRRIEEAWAVRPFNVYAATETAGIASECGRHAGLHLYEDLVITEVVDEKDRPVPPGVYGAKVLVTVLFNRTQPLIRYEMSDSVRLSSSTCSCGRPFALIDGIQGRMEDVLLFPGPAGDAVSVHPNVFHRILESVPASGWQVVQELDVLRVLVANPGGEFHEPTLLRRLTRELADQGASPPTIRIERVASIPRSANNKAPLIRSSGPSHPACENAFKRTERPGNAE